MEANFMESYMVGDEMDVWKGFKWMDERFEK